MAFTLPSAQECRLNPGEVHTWCVDLDVASDARARLQAVLTPEELTRSERFRFDSDRRRHIVSHGVLRVLLASYLKVQPERIRYSYNAFGKPGLTPDFGGRLTFNLSHSVDLAVIAVAAGTPVGVDVEAIRVITDHADHVSRGHPADEVEIARRFFAPAEVERLLHLPSRIRSAIFFTTWTRLEALAKARGVGLTGAFDGMPANADAERWSLYTLRPAPGYVGAVAGGESAGRLVQRRWRFSPGTPG